ncbi:MAG: thioredoxin family protein [Planctomycetota bacterium]
MDWHLPDAHAWQRARERGAAVLLLLEAPWCPYCKRQHETVWQDPAVQTAAQAFVCVRVADSTSGEFERLAMHGWPSLVLMDADGEPLNSSGPLTAEELAERLGQWAADAKAPAPPSRRKQLREAGDAVSTEVMARLLETADPKYGGWGQRQKFPHPEALHFALVRWSREGDPATLRLVNGTLQHMQAGAIHDAVGGGFFRYARTPDWGEPCYQKMLDSNAQRLLAYAEAWQALGTESFRQTGLGILDWMMQVLLDPATGAFHASQDEDAEYFRKGTLEARARMAAPPTDPNIYTDRNCDAVCALLKGSVAFQREDCREQALRTLDFVLEHLYRPGHGALHVWNGQAKHGGLLGDQAALLRALAWAVHYSGERRYLEPARELAETTLANYRKAADGSLVDQLHDVQARGSLGERQSNLADNARFAEALVRLSSMCEMPAWRRTAREILFAFRSDWKRFGNRIAEYGRAVDLLVHEPVEVTIVGARTSDAAQALRRAALRPYVASRIVQIVDPELDPPALQQSGWPQPAPGEDAVAYLHQSGQSYGRTTDPAALAGLMVRQGG